MKERRYFLHLEYSPKVWFDIFKEDMGVKVFVLSQMPETFHKLNTETGIFYGTDPKSDKEKLQTEHPEYDVFYLNILEISKEYNEINFDLSEQPDIVCAFVCVQKNEKEYVKKHTEFLDFIRIILQENYNNSNCWNIYVGDKQRKKLKKKYTEKYFLWVFGNTFSKKDKDFFEKCKTAYDIPQTEISLAKHIIKTHINSDKSVYNLTPEIVKKLRNENKTNGENK